MKLHHLLTILMSATTRLFLLQRCCTAFTTTSRFSGSRRGPALATLVHPFGSHQTRLFASDSDKDNNKKNKKPPGKKIRGGVPRKIKVNENITKDNADMLSAAFADMARKEGFDDSTAFFADDSTFEDDFDEDDLIVEAKEEKEFDVDAPLDADALLDAFDDDDDDDFLDFGSEADDGEDDMEARIASAQRDMDLGKVTISKELEKISSSDIDLRKLGFRRENNPFGDDETPRREEFRLITDAMICSACGSDFQSNNETRPGFLPKEKFQIQANLSKIEEVQKLKEKAASNAEWSPEDEIEYLIQTSDGDVNSPDFDEFAELDVDGMAEEMGLDLLAMAQKKVICKRCHGLQNFGKVENTLRPGWTDEPLMSQTKFKDLLAPLREKPAVIIALVDLFDFAGSVLTELDAIAGDNPVLLAANKVDLLPSKMGQQRAENWVRRELEYMGIQSIASVGGAVRLVSCKTGFGIAALLSKARQLAEEIDCDVYVVGAANAGKSTLINHMLEKNSARTPVWAKKRAGNANANKGALTVSPLPGTTLKFIKVDLGDGRSLFDTPGLLVPGTLTQLLTPEELKIVVPKKEVEPITFRVASGKCVLVGGLAKIEVIGEETKPYLFTFFVANDIKLHPTDSSKSEEFVSKHLGGMLTPPLEKREESWEWEHHDVEIEGAGWKEAAADITLRGLGWVAVTGSGTAKVRISVPKGIGVAVRPPLMPFDVWEVASRYTGGRAVRKVRKSKHGPKRKGVGRN